MPGYFVDYDTTVVFITQQELEETHSGLPHGGHVIRTGVTGWNRENRQSIEYTLKLDSNPQFTSSVLVACARAAMRIHGRGVTGCISMLEIAPADLSILSREEILKRML